MKSSALLSLFILAACASNPTPRGENTAEATAELERRYAEKVGRAQKSELVEEFGPARWCEAKAGQAEQCRFYRNMGTRWRGDKEDRTHYEAFDEVIADFDGNGNLRAYKVKAQR